MGREETKLQDFPLDHGPSQKSPLPPFFKGGLGGISEAARPNTNSLPFYRFFILTGQATNHVHFEQSQKIELRALNSELFLIAHFFQG